MRKHVYAPIAAGIVLALAGTAQAATRTATINVPDAGLDSVIAARRGRECLGLEGAPSIVSGLNAGDEWAEAHEACILGS